MPSYKFYHAWWLRSKTALQRKKFILQWAWSLGSEKWSCMNVFSACNSARQKIYLCRNMPKEISLSGRGQEQGSYRLALGKYGRSRRMLWMKLTKSWLRLSLWQVESPQQHLRTDKRQHNINMVLQSLQSDAKFSAVVDIAVTKLS